MEFRLLGALQPSACDPVHADQTGRGGEASSTSAEAAGKDGDDGGPDSNRIRSDSDVGGKPVGGRRAPAPIRRASILLPPRSLLVLTGEARYRWQHYIPHRKRDAVAGEDECVFREPRRVSFTFRETREGACACAWPDGCDSRDGAAQVLKERARPGAVAAAAAAAAHRNFESRRVIGTRHSLASHVIGTCRASVQPFRFWSATSGIKVVKSNWRKRFWRAQDRERSLLRSSRPVLSCEKKDGRV
jgi:hypothetical protein